VAARRQGEGLILSVLLSGVRWPARAVAGGLGRAVYDVLDVEKGGLTVLRV